MLLRWHAKQVDVVWTAQSSSLWSGTPTPDHAEGYGLLIARSPVTDQDEVDTFGPNRSLRSASAETKTCTLTLAQIKSVVQRWVIRRGERCGSSPARYFRCSDFKMYWQRQYGARLRLHRNAHSEGQGSLFISSREILDWARASDSQWTYNQYTIVDLTRSI